MAGVWTRAGDAFRAARRLREITRDGRIDDGGVLWLRPGRREPWVRVYDVAGLHAA